MMSLPKLQFGRRLDATTVGSITIDQIILVDKLPKVHFEATIRSVQSSCWGGRAPNVAVMLSKLGFKTAIISPVGEDFEQSGYLAHLKSLQIDVSRLRVIPREKTMRTIIITAGDSAQITLIELGAANHFPKIPMPASMIRESSIVHISSSGSAKFNVDAARMAKRADAVVSFDVGNDPCTKSAEYLEDMIRNVDLLFLNDVEMKNIRKRLGIDSSDELLKLGPSVVNIIGKEDRSSTIYTMKEREEIPSFFGSCVDPTGTSDAYVAGFLAGYLKQYSISKSGLLGAAEASFVVETIGSQTNLPSWQALCERVGIQPSPLLELPATQRSR